MKQLLLAPIACVILFAACKKDDPPSNYGIQGPYTTVSDVYKKLAPVSKTVSMSVSSGGSVYANGGTRFIIAPNSFRTATGSNVTGSVEVEVNDWLKRGDMIFGKVLPITATEPLVSGGQSYIRVTQNNQPVYLKPGAQIQINLPQFGNPVPGMSLFLGNQKPEEDNNTVNWVKTDTVSGGRLVYNGDTITMFTDSIGYANADQFMSTPNYQEFLVTAAAPVSDLTYFYAVALYDDYKAMWTLGGQVANVFNANHIPKIPVHMVVMALKDGDFYAGITAVTPVSGNHYTVTLTKTDPLAFKQQLNAL